MKEFLEFTFTNFWHFLGMLILIGMPFRFVMFLYNRLLRHFTIRKYGYPPKHCDADGDFKNKE